MPPADDSDAVLAVTPAVLALDEPDELPQADTSRPSATTVVATSFVLNSIVLS